MRRRRVTAALIALVIVAGLIACEPPPPRAQLVVDSTGAGADSDPGDGVCASGVVDGACTLPAAFDEANALGEADIILAAETYSAGTVTVTGDVALLGTGDGQTAMDGSLTVTPEAALRIDGIGTDTFGDVPLSRVSIRVDGSLHLTRSALAPYGTAIDVGATGGAVIRDSFVGSAFGTGISTAGDVIVDSSSAIGAVRFGNPGLVVWWQGAAAVRGSTLSAAGLACDGTPPISLGYNRASDGTCGLSGVGDADSAVSGVDAIPLGTGACLPGATDLYGNPRGVDGDSDGVGGCDVGPIELQP